MEYFRLGGNSVADEPGVVLCHPRDFARQTGIRTLIASKIQEVYAGVDMKFRVIHVIAANQIHERMF